MNKIDKWRLDDCKLVWHMDRIHKHYVLGKRIMPILIDIGITKLCNIRCEYCYGLFQKMTGEMIPADKLIQLFQDAPKIGVKAIAIIGDGEPTLHPALYDAILAGAEGGLDMGMATNGVKIDDDQMITLLNNLVWLRFTVSAVGDGYEIVHGKPYWDIVRKNIERAVRIKKRLNLPVTIGLQMVLTPNAFKYVIDEAKFAVAAGVDYFVIKQYSDPQCDKMPSVVAGWYDTTEVQDTLHQAERLSTFGTRIIVKYQAIEWTKKRPYDRCADVPLLFQISGDGKCYPCGYLFGDERYCYGDLKKQTLGKILESEHYWEIVNYMQTKFDVHKDCAGACRHNATNRFVNEFINRTEHINFI